MSSVLPQELVDEIVDYLHDDKAALKSCSVASSMFLPRSRHHLFRTVTVTHDQTNTNSFLGTCSESALILRSVRQLYIRDHVVCGLQPHVGSLFPLLKQVALESTNFRRVQETFPLHVSRLSFSSLSIATGMFQSAKNLCWCLRGLRKHGHLDIINCDISPSTTYADYFQYECHHNHVPVERLDFIDSDPRIYRMLSRCWGCLDQLACVHVYLGKGRDFDLLSTLLADTKKSLQELHVHVSQNFCNDKWLVTVNLDKLLDIGHLRDVSVHMWGIGMPSIPVLRWILASLPSCRSPSQLETIRFVVNLVGTSRPDAEQDFGFWRALNGALSGSQFERLSSIRVDIGVPETVRPRSPRQPQYCSLRTWDPRIMEQIGKGIQKQFASVGGRRRMLSVQVDKLVSDETYD